MSAFGKNARRIDHRDIPVRHVAEGPVARQGSRKKAASSAYVRDPDGNLLEFMID